MHTNTPEHTRQKFVELTSEKEVTLSAALNNFDIMTDNTSNNAIINSQERSDLSLTILPKELNTNSGRYKIVGKIDTALQNSLSHMSLMTTITPIIMSSDKPVQSLTENAASSLAPLSITSNSTFHATSTSASSMMSINHTALSSITTIPVNNNVMSTSSEMIVESTIADNRIEASIEPSTPPPPKILSQPISSGKTQLHDVLRSVTDSQVLPEQYPQRELLEKKLSFGSHKPVGTFSIATFNRAINNTNASRTPQMPIDNPTIRFSSTRKLSPNAIDTTISSVELQPKESIGQLKKSITESEENYFNADSSIFMNTPNFQKQTSAALLPSRIRNNNNKAVTELPEFILNGTKRTEKERGEGTVDLLSMHDFDSMPVKPKNDILQHFVNIIQSTSSEAPASSFSSAPLNSEAHKDSRVNIVGTHSSNSLLHQELHQSPMENHNEIAEHQFAAAHNVEVTRNISSRTTVKQGSFFDHYLLT